jgi:hypothetical protein
MKVKIVRDEDYGTITASIEHGQDPNTMSNHNVNKLVVAMLTELAVALDKEDEYEFDGIDTPTFNDGTISLVANLFIP